MPFTVTTPDFEGPLEVLLDLIQKRKMHISDVALADVTALFLSSMESRSGRRLHDMTEFLSVAATLLLIKSKALIPDLELSMEEEESTQELKDRLERYAQVRKWRKEIEARLADHKLCAVSVQRPQKDVPQELVPPEVGELRGVMQRIIDNLPKPLISSRVSVASTVKLADVVENISRRVSGTLSFSYRDFVGEAGDKRSHVIHFLALLELLKKGEVDVQQKAHNEDIIIESRMLSTPRYTT